MTDRWLRIIDQHSKRFDEAFGTLDEAPLNWKPSPASWSIAQVTEHLIKTNESYYSVWENAANGTHHVPAISRIPFYYQFIGKMILGSVEAQRKRKVRTMAMWEPSTSAIAGDIIHRFLHHHDEMKSMIGKYKMLFEKNPVISSPANKYISYTAQTGIEIILAHELRHFNQAVEIAELQKPSSKA